MNLDAIEAICRDPDARRELLWLRAKEKEDEESRISLEEVDPGIVRRLEASGFDITEREGEHWRDRRERFAQLYEECYDLHAARLCPDD